VLPLIVVRPEHIHCIQMLPFTPVTEDLLKYSFVTNEYKVLQNVLRPGYDLKEEWKTYVFMDLAFIDPATAWDKASFLTNDGFGRGNSRTNTYWWIATRPKSPPLEEKIRDHQRMKILQEVGIVDNEDSFMKINF